ncbi:CynX/NimT family MFS transporter [Solibacillus daqui]|uniref:MFS transporter n=1 Tax=Solibacillus daqui TaxID=2912187 RepID=UPI002366FC93|nr:MFS transporter [Solibacillus daqui]
MNQKNIGSKLLILLAIFLVSINLRPSVTSVGPILSTISEALNVSSTQMSLLTSIPVFCMGLFAPLAVPFQKKFGYKWSITLLLVLIGVATLARIIFSSYSALVVTSFLAGFAIAIISPMINAFIKEKFPTKIAPVIGLYSFAIGFGATLSSGFTGIFYESFEGNWALALGVWGVLALVAMISWLLTVDSGQAKLAQKASTEPARNPWKNGLAWTILIYFGFQTSLFFSLTTWLVSIAEEQGMSLLTAGSVLTLMTIVQLVGNIVIPSMINKFPNRIAWLFGLVLMGLIGSVFFFIDVNWAIWVGTIIYGAVLSGLFPIGLMLPLDEAKNNQEANEWSSMVLSGGFMMSAVIPLVIGYVFDITGNHFITKLIFVTLFILMSISIFVMQKMKKSL